MPDIAQGGIWLGLWVDGVAHFKDGRVLSRYTEADGLGKGALSDLQLDPDGTLWAGTEGGLSRIQKGRIATLSRANGLPCDGVHWMRRDKSDSVWLYMPCGLVQLAKSELDLWAADPTRTVKTTTFDGSSGVRLLARVSGYGPHVAEATDGRFWFVGGEGVSVLDPHHMALNNVPPPVTIEQVRADGKPYDPTTGLRLPALVRDVSIRYAALSLAAPEKVRFRYKLEGQDADWREVVNEREVQYSNLAPREYRFRVLAANNSGVWNEMGDTLEFSIAPAYYQTLWFQSACGLAFLAFLWGAYRYRLYQVAHEFNVRLEERVSERTRLARDLHDTLLQSFQGLMLRLQVVNDLLPEGKVKQQLEQTLERADQAIAEGRDAVCDLRSSATTTNELAQAVKALGDELATQDSAAFRLVVEGPTRDLHPIVRDELYRITREALRNAFSHARAKHVEAEITYGERAFQLRIRDDGNGILPEVLAEGRLGHYGLSGMRERAKQIGGKLDIWSGAGAGTEIEVNIEGSIAYATVTDRPRFRLFRKKAG